MNRRNFLKRCSLIPFVGSLAIAGEAVASEAATKSAIKYPIGASTSIDPNSEWANQKPLTLTKLMKAKESLDATIDEDFLIPVDKDLYIYYDFAEKMRITYKIDGDVCTIIKHEKFSEHPFCSFGKTQEKIDSGEITYVIQKCWTG